MLRKRIGITALGLVLLLLMAVLPVRASDAGGVPGAVLDAKAGVLRILITSEYGVYTGSGFAVGSGNRVYVVTNHHVIEDAEDIFVFYNTGEYVTARIIHDDPSRDLCVLKPDKPIPDVVLLPLESAVVESGIGVYALGYPAAADYFTMDLEEEFDTVDDFLPTVTADKQSMTITDGIVSALHKSPLIGDGSRDVEMLQTNTTLNGGNSGGPLLDGAGRVVGVNTMGLTDAQDIYGAVHVTELMRVLRAAGVPYGTGGASAKDEGGDGTGTATTNDNTPMIVILSGMGVVLVGGIAAAVAVGRRQKKALPAPGALSLADFEKSNRRVEEIASLEMGLRFVNSLLPLARYNLSALLSPDNVMVADNAIVLKDENTKTSRMAAPPVYPGYSAPEALQSGQSGPAAQVYFVGALLYTMITGVRPPEALARFQAGGPAFFPAQGPVQALVNRAMEPNGQNRIPDLYRLAYAMQEVLAGLPR